MTEIIRELIGVLKHTESVSEELYTTFQARKSKAEYYIIAAKLAKTLDSSSPIAMKLSSAIQSADSAHELDAVKKLDGLLNMYIGYRRACEECLALCEREFLGRNASPSYGELLRAADMLLRRIAMLVTDLERDLRESTSAP